MLTIHPEKIYISSANVDIKKYRRLVCVDLTLSGNSTLLSLLGLIPVCVPLNSCLSNSTLISSKQSIGFSPPSLVLSTTILELPMLFFNIYFLLSPFFRDEG